MERQSESVRFLEVRHPHSRTTLEMGAPSDERWTEVPFVGSDDETAMEPRRHGGGRTGRWIAAGVAVGAILLVLVAALALTDPARTRGAAPENDASPQTRATSAANAGHAATLGRSSTSTHEHRATPHVGSGHGGSHERGRLAGARVMPGPARTGENEMVTLVDLNDLETSAPGEKSEAARGWRKGDERWLKPSTIEAHVHAADDELTNEYLDKLPARVPAHAIAEVKWAAFDESKDRVDPPPEIGSYANEEIDWTVVKEKKAAAAGAAEGVKQTEQIKTLIRSERLAEQARMDANYGRIDAPKDSFLLAPICLAVVSSVVVIAVLLVRNRGPGTRGGDRHSSVGHLPTERDPLLGSNRSHDSGKSDLRDLEDIESGGRVHGGDGSVDMNRRAASSTDGAESNADSFPTNHQKSSTDDNLHGLMASMGMPLLMGSRNTAMDRLIDDSRSEVAPSEAPSTVFEINPPRWVSKMFGVGPGSSAHPRDSENSQSIQSERNGVEEAAAAAAREVARELGAGGTGAGGVGASRGNSSRGESVFSAADFSDAEAYADYVGGVGGHGVKPRGGSAHGSTDKVNRAMAREGRAGPSSAHASAFARPPPPHLQSRSSGGSSNLSTGKPPRPFAAPMAGAGRPVPPERPPQIVKSTTRFL